MPQDALSRPSVAAVITAFDPGEGLADAVAGAVAQASPVIVVDDGSTAPESARSLDRAAELGAIVVRQGENRGIGAALNTGIETARGSDGRLPDYVLTLDQDSTLPDGYVDELLASASAAARDGISVGMAAPGTVGSMRRGAGAASRRRAYEIGGEPIQSGLLVPGPVLDLLEGFREDLFIDGVDSDFYLRARQARLACVVAPGATLAHRLGRGHEVRLGGRDFEVTVASDFRYYYQGRNLVALARSYGTSAPGWTMGAVARQARHLGIVTVLVPGRGNRAREFARGVLDGLRGRSGRRPEPTDPVGTRAVRRPRAGALEDEPASRPRVSVCMAAYRGAAYVTEQLGSILAQLGPDDEVVVVDDASPDDTVAVIEAIGDERIRLVRQVENRGYVRTFERALSEASGDVMLLADQDDVWLPGRVDAMVRDLATADVVATNLTTLEGSDAIRGPYGQADWHLRAANSPHRARNVLGILAGNMPYYGCAMGVRREALRRTILPFPAFLDESHDLWIALAANLRGTILHDERRSLARRFHDSNASPTRPRGPLAVVRSRILLLRCILDLGRRVRM